MEHLFILIWLFTTQSEFFDDLFENIMGKGGNALKPLQHSDNFQQPWDRSLLKTFLEKGEMLVTTIFSFSNSFFLPFPKQI